MKTLYFKKEEEIRLAYTNEEETNTQEIIDYLTYQGYTQISATSFNNLKTQLEENNHDQNLETLSNLENINQQKFQTLLEAGFTSEQATAILSV